MALGPMSLILVTIRIQCTRSFKTRNGRSRSSKVVDFGTNRKRLCGFLIPISIQ